MISTASPHLAEDWWKMLGHKDLIAGRRFHVADSLTKEEERAQLDVYKRIVEEPPVIKKAPQTDRGKVIHILASRLFQDYVKNAGNMTRPNPLRDGIPGCACSLKSKVGCVDWCGQDKLGPRIRTASAQQVYDWIVEMVKRRANIVDSSKEKR